MSLHDLPVLSVRQPWAWLIVNGWKNVENRTKKTKVRGPILIHASSLMTRGDYESCLLFISAHGFELEIPDSKDLPRGGIVGQTTILDCVDHHPSDWFTGPHGYVLADSKPLPFTPAKGRLGFFTLAKDEMAQPEIFNGQVWKQHDFPYFEIMVLMLEHVNGVLMFCKVGTGCSENPPLVMTEEDGTWMYSEKDLLSQLRARKYAEAGIGRIKIVLNAPAERRDASARTTPAGCSAGQEG